MKEHLEVLGKPELPRRPDMAAELHEKLLRVLRVCAERSSSLAYGVPALGAGLLRLFRRH
jgi:hypothetical protein